MEFLSKTSSIVSSLPSRLLRSPPVPSPPLDLSLSSDGLPLLLLMSLSLFALTWSVRRLVLEPYGRGRLGFGEGKARKFSQAVSEAVTYSAFGVGGYVLLENCRHLYEPGMWFDDIDGEVRNEMLWKTHGHKYKHEHKHKHTHMHTHMQHTHATQSELPSSPTRTV